MKKKKLKQTNASAQLVQYRLRSVKAVRKEQSDNGGKDLWMRWVLSLEWKAEEVIDYAARCWNVSDQGAAFVSILCKQSVSLTRRGGSGGWDGRSVPVCVDRSTARTDQRRQLRAVYWANTHLFIQRAVLRSDAAFREHESPGKSHVHSSRAYCSELYWNVAKSENSWSH